jgi:hypothetical protein
MNQDIGTTEDYTEAYITHEHASSLPAAVVTRSTEPNQRVKQLQHLQTKDALMPRELWVALRGPEMSIPGSNP